MKKHLKCSLAFVAFLSACSAENETRIETRVETPASPAAPSESATQSLWNGMVSEDSASITMARWIAPLVPAAPAESSLDPVTLERWKTASLQTKRMSVIGKGNRGDLRYLEHTILVNPRNGTFVVPEFVRQMDLESLREEQRRAIRAVMTVWETRSNELAESLAAALVQQISSEHPESPLAEVAKSGNLRSTLEELKKYDHILSRYEIHRDDETKVIILGLVAAKLVSIAKDDPLFLQVKKKVSDAQEMAKKAKELRLIAKSVTEAQKSLKRDLSDMVSASEDFASSMRKSRTDILEISSPSVNRTTRKSLLRLGKDILKGDLNEDGAEGASFLGRRREVQKDLDRLVGKAAAAANQIDSIVKSAEAAARILGVEMSPSIQKTIDDVRKVTAGVKLAQAVGEGLKSGGLIGALGAFGGGDPSGVALGLVGMDPASMFQKQVMAEISALREEIQEVQRLQRHTIELQMETINMVKNLTHLVEAYHHEEMAVLAELRGMSEEQLSMLRSLIHRDVRACENIVNFALYQEEKSMEIFYGEAADLTRASVYGAARDLDRFRELFVADGGNHRDCRRAIENVFSGGKWGESPLMQSARVADEGLANSLRTFLEQAYVPLLAQVDGSDPAISVPAATLDGLRIKTEARGGRDTVSGASYDVLLSPASVERYADMLMILGPIMSFPAADLEDFVKSPVSLKLRPASERLAFWTNWALRATKTAIAQEAILAGEPLLENEAGKFAAYLRSDGQCAAGKESYHCALFANPLIQRNFLVALLRQRMQFSAEAWDRALDQQDVAAISAMIGSDLRGLVVRVDAGKVGLRSLLEPGKNSVLAVEWRDSIRGSRWISLPRSKELLDGKIVYTENMSRLARTLDRLLDFQQEQSPLPFGSSDRKAVLQLLIGGR
ncbi:MAG: hypothetical protein HUU37_00445 [Bdellovibrionales bacterium]|nr:hypothetical protein [Bdellovibrionales bacterium]